MRSFENPASQVAEAPEAGREGRSTPLLPENRRVNRITGHLLLALLAGICTFGEWTGAAAQPSSSPPTKGQAENAILREKRSTDLLYVNGRGNGHQRSCDTLAGEDCFGGQFECHACGRFPTRGQMIQLGEAHDALAELVARAQPGVTTELLDWVAGQRAGVWTRMGAEERAREAVDECVASAWWCVALRGFVEHNAGQYVLAESYFREALAAMPEDLACYWNELVLYHDTLGPSAGHRGGRSHCAPLEAYDAFWTIADPLFSQPGNERMTEHYARHVDMRIHSQWLTIRNGHHPLTHHSEVLRYGWPTGWEDWSGRRHLIFGRGGQGFLVLAPVEDALRAGSSLFEPVSQGATETFRARFGIMTALPIQTGFFRRNGRPVLVARSTDPAGTNVASQQWTVHAWNGSGFATAPAEVEKEHDQLTAWLDVPWEPQIVSLEAVHDSGALRARTGTDPPDSTGAVVVSSLVILDNEYGTPASLEEAVRRMQPRTTIEPGTPVSAFWEVYTARPLHATIEFTTTSTARRNFFARLFGGGAGPARRVRWTEEWVPADGVVRRSFGLDIDRLPPGPYELLLSITPDEGSVLSTSIRIVVE
jgi:hypothetical protein